MSRSVLSETLRHKISAVKEIQCISFSAESSIREELGISSMELITILTDVSMALGIDMMKFSERDIVTAVTVGDLERVLVSKLP